MRQDKIGEVILIGNPNAGKSTLFNLLTGGHAKVGNWHGVTVGALEREAKFQNTRLLFCDLPGIYSLEGMTLEEKGALQYIEEHKGAFLLFVSEYSSLGRSIPLFQKLARGRRCALVLTKRKLFEKRGGTCDLTTLKNSLKIPVFSSDGSKRKLKEEIFSAAEGEREGVEMGDMAGYRPPKTILTGTEKLFNNGLFCIFTFLLLLVFCFYVTFAPNLLGDRAKGLIEKLFFERLSGYAEGIASPVLKSFVIDGILRSVGSVLCFLPQIILLFLFLLVMEESGYLSRLAMHTDGFFSRIGLSGRAVFSLLMGFGCSAAAIMTTRGLDNKHIQRRVILCLPYISCSAKLPVFLTLSASFFKNPFVAVLLLYALGVGIALFVALFLKKQSPPFVMELAPLQIPSPLFIVKGLCFQVKQFIIKLSTVIFAFFLVSWVLSSFSFGFTFCPVEESMLAKICGFLKFLFAPIGMNDWKIAYAALSGLIAKENVAGALNLFYGKFPYSAASAFAFSVFILTCSPCVSAIAATAREWSAKAAVLIALLQTVTALLLSYAVYFLSVGGVIPALIALAPIVGILIMGKHRDEKISRGRGHDPTKIHR